MEESQVVLQPVDPVEYLHPYFATLKKRDLSIFIGTVILLRKFKIKLLTTLLNLSKIEVEELIGRLLQSDFLEGSFEAETFNLEEINIPILKQHPNLTLDDRIMLAYLKARFSVTFEELGNAFSLNFEALVFVLSGFITKGLISATRIDEDRVEIVTHYTLPKKEPQEVNDIEKRIVGYSILKRFTTFEQITIDLDIPEHRVQSVITDMILSDLILCNFQIRQNFLQKYELMIEIKRFLILFTQRTVEMMSDDERYIIGLVLLRKKISLKEISQTLKIDRFEIIGFISKLTATRDFEFLLTDKQNIQPYSPMVFQQSKTIDQIASRSLFNYRVLLGIITTEKKIGLNQIQKKMDAPKYDITKGIIELFLSGLLTGYFRGSNTFVLEGLQQQIQSQDVTLEDWERILIGALIAEGVISWPKIAALLEIDRNEAREKAYSIISKGLTNIQAKDSVLTISEIPVLPPLVQISDLELIDQQILGYLFAKPVCSLKGIRNLFKLTSKEVYRRVYYLSGSGLFVARKGKGVFHISKPRLVEPSVPVSELELDLQNTVKSMQEHYQDKKDINLNKLARVLGMTLKQVKWHLTVLISNGYYQGILNHRKFVVTRGLFKVKGKPTCFTCRNELIDFRKRCPECQTIPPRCTVCTGALSSNDNLVACPFCQYKSHSNHIREWLKIKGQCPICRNQLDASNLIII